jgi:NDP-sugar pyrophosphorylase family protein
MKAMLFAAGLGTRLQELTKECPKALVNVQGKTLLQHSVEHLKKNGCTYIVINVHHFAEKILKELKKEAYLGLDIKISDEREYLLETGGGLLKAAKYLDGESPFLAYNVDVLSNINLQALYKQHCASNALATLAVRDRISSRYLLFDQDNTLCGWTNTQTGALKTSKKALKTYQRAFSGIQVINPAIFDLIEQQGRFSITTSYLELATNHCIEAYEHDKDYWFDVGKPERLEAAENFLHKFNS